MKIWANIHQLTSDGTAFINVNENNFGQVGVWGMKHLSILALAKNRWTVINFDNQDYLNEWWAEHSDEYDKLIYLETI
jgi:hypothetical protein